MTQKGQRTKMSLDIDFLPSAFHEAGVQRKTVTWRTVVVAVFAVCVLTAALYQQHLRRQTEDQLLLLEPQSLRAETDSKRLATLQQELRQAEKQAELGAYLSHPWPRSQILAEIVEALPDEIELERLDIGREMPAGPQAAVASPQGGPPGQTQAVIASPAEHDLAQLREEYDKSQVAATLTGLTDDPGALHHYLDQLGREPLFAKVNLTSIERVPGDSSGRLRFVARLLVKPGFGQSTGPLANELKEQAPPTTSSSG